MACSSFSEINWTLPDIEITQMCEAELGKQK